MPYAINPGDRAETLYGSACASHRPPLFDFAPDGVFHARSVTRPAVGSYPTFSPLPAQQFPVKIGGIILCGTFPRVAPARCYLASFFRGARTFLDP